MGENSRSGDMAVNPSKEKKLTNIRAAGSDDNILLKPPRELSLEAALEYIEDDELGFEEGEFDCIWKFIMINELIWYIDFI